LQEAFGYECVDNGDVPGTFRSAVGERLFVALGSDHLWPVEQYVDEWDEDTLFDMMEFLHDHVSTGVRESGGLHDYASCGWHFNQFAPDCASKLHRRAGGDVSLRRGVRLP